MAENPQFPAYPPPQPNQGVPVAERKQSDPLWKLAKLMMKPHRQLDKTPFSKPKKHKAKYY